MEVPIDTSKMTEQELQFHYFKMHDADNNNKLDGCELIKSLIHWHGKYKYVYMFFFLIVRLYIVCKKTYNCGGRFYNFVIKCFVFVYLI